ncbi:MAG: acyl-CoA dehydratase activase [Candidatus Syntropharchaeia archaeon]
MISAGIDVGSLCTKTVILEDEKILSYSILRSGAAYRGAAESSMNEALKNAGLKIEEVKRIISTGYGRRRVPFADREVTEITCHATGAKKLFPDVHTVIDIGGQDSKVIRVNDEGRAINFVMNDKCAAGTGRFLEVMALALEVDIEELGELSFQSKKDIEVSSICTVFAETEVISLLSQGEEKADIASAIHRSIARRIVGMVGQLGIEERIVMTGGVAKNPGTVHAIEELLGKKISVPEEPQIVGAFGAAIIAGREE